jgi:predicted transcriptional regulator
MHSSLDDVAFLASSPNRVEVLSLIQTAPRKRDDLKEATDVSRVTLSRILSELEERGWITRTNHQYEPTPRGSFVAEEFTQLLENMDAALELDDELAWLPVEKFGFDLDCLRDAEIVTPSHSDHTAAIRRVSAAARDAEWVKGTATGVSRDVLDAIRDLTVEREGSLEFVLTPEAVAVIRTDAGLRHRFHDVLESGRATVYRYDGDEPILMVLMTNVSVLLCGHDEEGPPPGTVETVHESVQSWATAYFASRRADSRELGVEAFTP